MGGRTTIEWTEATWNPVTGCTKVSAGCDNCYAHHLAHMRLKDVYTQQLPILDTPRNRQDPFAVRIWPERLSQPERWRSSRMIFVNSMSDLFHKDVPIDYVRSIFEVMLQVDRHTYQVLTKRPARALHFWRNNRDLFNGGPIPPHIWLGTSVESQEVHHRVEQLKGVPASIRFLSCEPLLDSMQLSLSGIHWVIVGGESGIGFRPTRHEWVREIRDQALAEGVPFFFKQWGGRTPKAGGRALDGRTWDEFPVNHQLV